MNQQASFSEQDQFSQFVVKSALAHGFVVLLFIVKTVVWSPSEPIEYQSAARVDLIALPDKLTPDEVGESAPITAPAVKPKPSAANDAVNLDSTKSKQTAAMDRLKQQSAFEKIQNELNNENKRAVGKPKLLKGNQLSSGSQLTGVSRLQADAYVGDVERHIRQNWTLPQWLSKKDLRAQVQVRFDKNGQIISAQIIRPSGNATFDEIVIATVQKSSPVPPPPEKFVRILEFEGIVFGFPE